MLFYRCFCPQECFSSIARIAGSPAKTPPISPGPMPPALIGGVLAGETAIRAIESNDFSEKNLWQYNIDFVNHYGNKTAGLEAFRMYLQTLNNQEINYGMRHFLSGKEALRSHSARCLTYHPSRSS